MRHCLTITLLALACLTSPALMAQDTIRPRVTLPEVVVKQKNVPPNSALTQTPTQVAEVERMELIGSTQVVDALRQMAGATIKDYGGIGGIKTVSVRGMGSQFSTLTIDGVAVNDCQNGQVDLGRYSIGNVSFYTLSNGQSSLRLQAARAYAAGSVVSMESHEPDSKGAPYRLRAALEAGSFGYMAPSLNYEQRLGSKTAITLWGNYLHSDGNYPYTLYYSPTHQDSSARLTRHNSAVSTGTADMNLFHTFAPRKRLHLKLHYMQGSHQLPGPVIYYNVRESAEHTSESLLFAQARYRQEGRRCDWQLIGKYQRATDLYEDTANTAGHVLNLYNQQEAYLSQGALLHAWHDEERQYLNLGLSADESVSLLHSNLAKHNEVQRLSLQEVLTANYQVHLWEALRGVTLNAHLLGTYIQDRDLADSPDAAATVTTYRHLSPYAGMSWSQGLFTLRYFYKRNYRVPNFNELYYFSVGRALEPETGSQHNAGITLHTGTQPLRHIAQGKGLRHRLNVTLDVYYNRVSNKIIAIPTQNMFIWSMRNLGEVDIRGVDIASEYTLHSLHHNNLRLDATAGYSYQRAVNITTPGDKVYGHQIPYTPRHSGNATLLLVTPWVNAGYSVTWVGTRYSGDQNSDRNRMEPYADHGITLSRDMALGKRDDDGREPPTLRLKLQVLNIFDTQYEVVRSYPMMGRNYRVALAIDL